VCSCREGGYAHPSLPERCIKHISDVPHREGRVCTATPPCEIHPVCICVMYLTGTRSSTGLGEAMVVAYNSLLPAMAASYGAPYLTPLFTRLYGLHGYPAGSKRTVRGWASLPVNHAVHIARVSQRENLGLSADIFVQ